MKINIVATVSVVLLLICNFWLYIKMQRMNNDVKQRLTINETFSNHNQINKYQYEKDIHLKDVFVFKDKDSIKLSRILVDSYRFVYYYNENSCSTCIKNELDNLTEYTNNTKRENWVIIAQYNNILNVKFLSNYADRFDIYYLKESADIGLGDLSKTMSVQFLLTNNLTPKFIFVPEKNVLGFSKSYYAFIKKIIDNE